ncbi:MAG: hypothetical protein HGA85_04485 [Nanoarchaeota archaeon]|nr:hypothetical protein [Nanoarchaeota archaeon]
MLPDNIIARTGSVIADINKSELHARWVRQPAAYVDIEKDYSDLWLLSSVMKEFLGRNDWGAVSSNNIYWQETENPISVMVVPTHQSNKPITLVNPKIIRTSEKRTSPGLEGCGSIGEPHFIVKRPFSAEIEAYVLETSETQNITLYGRNARYALHEADHLEGKIISDSGIFCGLLSRAYSKNMELFNEFYLRQLTDMFSSGMPQTLAHLVLIHEETPVWYAVQDKEEIPERVSYGKPISFGIFDSPFARGILSRYGLAGEISRNNFTKTKIVFN